MSDLGPVPTRIPADADLVRRLIRSQFPQWADLPVRRVLNEGWDNRTFHLGESLSVRLPSAEPYALAVEKEHRWLPEFARRLPKAIPVPVAKGAPGEGYPHVWSVYRWLDGEPTTPGNIADPNRFAADLADFLVALQRVDPSGGPGPGLHNWYRGGSLQPYAGMTERNLQILGGSELGAAVERIWRSTLKIPLTGSPVWFHGDIAVGNLLVVDGELSAVIDFGTCGVGDPACDLAIAWTLFSGDARSIFRDRIGADAQTWARGRGWALWKALAGYADSLESGEEVDRQTEWVLQQIISDDDAGEPS